MVRFSRGSLGAGVLSDRLGAFGHGVFRQLSGQQQSHRGLHLSAGDGGALVILSQARCLRGNSLKQVVNEGVHDAHGPAGYTRVRVDLKK